MKDGTGFFQLIPVAAGTGSSSLTNPTTGNNVEGNIMRMTNHVQADCQKWSIELAN